MQAGSKHGIVPVLAAVMGNAIVSIIKLSAALTSGSSAMFSEAIHSFADTANQIFLLIGITRSRKKATEDFVYGYGRERFFWAVLSACGVFFVGAGVTMYHGITSLIKPEPVEISPFVFAVLGVSFVVELATFFIAAHELREANPHLTWTERLNEGDPSTLAVFLEDGIAVLGVLIASAAIGLSYVTGNGLWDAVGSIIISVLLGVAALILISKNRGYLIGKAMPEEIQDEILELLASDPAVERVLDFKSTTLDVGVYRLTCEVEINGHALIGDYLQQSLPDAFEEIDGNYESFKRFVVTHTDRIPRLIGTHIDLLEAKIQAMFPGIRHVDIEVN